MSGGGATKPFDFGFPFLAALGASSIIFSSVAYWLAVGSLRLVRFDLVGYYQLAAEVYLLVLAAGVTLVLFDFRRTMQKRIETIRRQGFASISPWWLLPYVFSMRRYRNYFLVATILYGLFYAFVSSVLVYQPTVDFATAYGAPIPSAEIAVCCGPPLYVPMATVYIVNHLGMLLIPLTILLLIAISILVGLNFALSAFAYGNRTRGTGKGWAGGVGAAVGLFTGCPTCAGLFFVNVLGGSGAVSLAAGLSYYQPAFIALSIPVLVATPYLISRSLSKIFREGCVLVKPRPD